MNAHISECWYMQQCNGTCSSVMVHAAAWHVYHSCANMQLQMDRHVQRNKGSLRTFAFALAITIVALVLLATSTERPSTRFGCCQGRPRHRRGCSTSGWQPGGTTIRTILAAILLPGLIPPWHADVNPLQIHRHLPAGRGPRRRRSQCRLAGKGGCGSSWGCCGWGCWASTILRACLRLLRR